MRNALNVKPVITVKREGPLSTQIRRTTLDHLHHTGGVVHFHVIDTHVGFILTCSRAPPQKLPTCAFNSTLFLAGFGVIEGFAGIVYEHHPNLFRPRQFTKGEHLCSRFHIVVFITHGVRLKERVNDEHIELPHFNTGEEVHHGWTVDRTTLLHFTI